MPAEHTSAPSPSVRDLHAQAAADYGTRAERAKREREARDALADAKAAANDAAASRLS